MGATRSDMQAMAWLAWLATVEPPVWRMVVPGVLHGGMAPAGAHAQWCPGAAGSQCLLQAKAVGNGSMLVPWKVAWLAHVAAFTKVLGVMTA